MRGYLALLRRHPRPIAFAFLCAVASSFGQTFFVSLFAEDIEADLGIGRTLFSTIYGGATLASAFVMPLVGRGIDHLDLKRYAPLSQLALALGCLGLAFAPGVVLFSISVFLVRGAGQGLMTHIESTSTSRFFTRSRGKALGLTALGHPAGEGLFPILFTALTGALGWRAAWAVAAGVVILGVIPLGLWLLSGRDTRPAFFRAADDEIERTVGAPEPGPGWTRAQVYKHPGFLLLAPYMLAPAFVLTGTFFHQLTLAAEMGWTEAWLAASFVAFAVGRSVAVLVAGPLIDRFGGRRMMLVTLLPLIAGLSPLALTTGPAWAPVYLALAGTTVGLAPIRSAWMAEHFGTEHLGAIRSGLFAVVVLATSVSPPLYGLMLDAGLALRTILLWTVGLMLGAVVLAAAGLKLLDQGPRSGPAERPAP